MAEYVKVDDLNLEALTDEWYAQDGGVRPVSGKELLAAVMYGVPTVVFGEERSYWLPDRTMRRLVGPWEKVDDETLD